MVTSGIRLGTPAGTTRGFGPAEFRQVGELIGRVLDGLAANPRGQRGRRADGPQRGTRALPSVPDLSGALRLRGRSTLGGRKHALPVLR